jgi:hypothetical protein
VHEDEQPLEHQTSDLIYKSAREPEDLLNSLSERLGDRRRGREKKTSALSWVGEDSALGGTTVVLIVHALQGAFSFSDIVLAHTVRHGQRERRSENEPRGGGVEPVRHEQHAQYC